MSKNAQITNFVNKCKFDLVTSKSKQISKKAGKNRNFFKVDMAKPRNLRSSLVFRPNWQLQWSRFRPKLSLLKE